MIMFLCMVLGVAVGLLEIYGYLPFRLPSSALPWLIFAMLFFTFLRISPRQLRFRPWHFLLIVYQLVVSVAIFCLLRYCPVLETDESSLALAQGVALCVLMPAATAAPIIAAKIGGSVLELTPFTLLSSVLSAVLIPAVFPLWNPWEHISFFPCFLMILRRVGPMLILPAICAWCIRGLVLTSTPNNNSPWVVTHSGISRRVVTESPFYLWMLTIIILMEQLVHSVHEYNGPMILLLYMSVGALATCLLQFYCGRHIGGLFPGRDGQEVTMITAGQALGQKNTTLAIWLAHSYLIPIAAIAPAAYIVAQNLVNSWQLQTARSASDQKNK